jgi:GntR family transcriptional regulator
VPAVPMSYVQIADDLSARIAAGEYQPGDRLPRTVEIAELYSCSTSTAYRAVSLLKMQGLVSSVQGKGTFVATGAVR